MGIWDGDWGLGLVIRFWDLGSGLRIGTGEWRFGDCGLELGMRIGIGD